MAVDIEISRSEGSEALGAVLFLNFTGKLTVNGLSHYRNRNSHSLGQGTAAVMGKSLTTDIANSRFEGNWAAYGSALYLYSTGFITVASSLFIGNTATTGGAIALELFLHQHVRFTLLSTVFMGNSAVDFGGAVAVLRSMLDSVGRDSGAFLYSCELEFSNSSFQSNTAQDGAAMYVDCSTADLPCTLRFSSVVLRSNTAESILSLPFDQLKLLFATQLICSENEGNCIRMERTSGYCEHCQFRGNRAVSGTAFHMSKSNLTFQHSHFHNNSAEAYGGVGFLKDVSWLGCNFCLFSNNSAERLGGALYVQSSSLSLDSSQFTSNFAQSGGFALVLYNCPALSYAAGTSFARNYGNGIAVLSLLSANLSLTECSFEWNSGSRLTGGVYVYSSNLTAYKCQFSRQIGYSGVFVYFSQQSSAYIEASNFSNGAASSSGGAATVIDSNVHFERCQFRGLSAQFGGALFIQNSANLIVQNSEFLEVTNVEKGVISGFQASARVCNSLFTLYTQSAIFGEGMLVVEVGDSEFTKAVGSRGGGLLCMDCTQISVVGSKFGELRTETGGALCLTGNSILSSANWTISNSTFDSCIANAGGAVYAETCSVCISDCFFLNNTAMERGGAILLAAQTPVLSIIQRSSFTRNWAGLKGGGICWEGTQSPPKFTDNQNLSNTALYGNDVASFPIALALKSSASLSNVASGQMSNIPIILELVDYNGQVVTIEKSSFAQINSSNVEGATRVLVSNGRFTFSDYSIISTPGTTTLLTIITTALEALVTLEVLLRNCTVGEALINGQCIPCAPNSYNLEAGVSCEECPEEAQCLGNFTILPKAGYWRASNSTDRFFACLHEKACKGYPDSMNLTGECAEGYEGNKCETCTEGYFRWSRVRCSKCPSSSMSFLGQLGIWAAVLLLIGVLIKSTTSNATQLKIFLNYLQLVMLFDSFHLSWPELMLNLFNAQEAVGGFPESLFSFSCLYEDESELQTYSRKLIVLSFLLPLLVFISCCVWLGVAACKRSIVAVRNNMVASGIVVFFTGFPSVMRVLLGVLHCEEVLPGEYWVVGLNLRCWQSSHYTYAFGLALPCLLLWGVAVPAVIFLFLTRQRTSADYSIRYGFLTTGYRTDRFYWEYVVIYRKLLIIVFIVFFSQVSLFLQVLSTLGVLLGSIIFQDLLRPYSLPALNSFELRSLLVAAFTLYSGLFFYSETVGEAGKLIIFALVSILNVAFTFLCLSSLVYGGLRQIIKKMTSLRSKQPNSQKEQRQAT